uniref:Uncharacterized protein n=1 Tax=Vespula pensylvanica TaxID=30213 RepID=A0A834NQN4_VESPE|nr:hypothetical protein H0235_012251 [Vespula pensylvanica]
MTRSHDNAYSGVNEWQLGPTVSNDANKLLGNKRRKVLFDQGVLKLLNGLGSQNRKPLNVQSDFRFRPDNKSHDVPFSDGGRSNPGCFPGPVGRSVCSNASLASPHDYLSKRFTEQSETTT